MLLSNDPSASLVRLSLLVDSTLFINGEFSLDDVADVVLLADPFLFLPEAPWRRSLEKIFFNKVSNYLIVLSCPYRRFDDGRLEESVPWKLCRNLFFLLIKESMKGRCCSSLWPLCIAGSLRSSCDFCFSFDMDASSSSSVNRLGRVFLRPERPRPT